MPFYCFHQIWVLTCLSPFSTIFHLVEWIFMMAEMIGRQVPWMTTEHWYFSVCEKAYVKTTHRFPHPISWLRDFTRCCAKRSGLSMNRNLWLDFWVKRDVGDLCDSKSVNSKCKTQFALDVLFNKQQYIICCYGELRLTLGHTGELLVGKVSAGL